MTDKNIVTSASLKPDTPKKTAKKASAKKVATPQNDVEDGKVVIIFESGASYNSNGLRFTREDNIQEVTKQQADFLLTLDNFRLPDQIELEEYLRSKEG